MTNKARFSVIVLFLIFLLSVSGVTKTDNSADFSIKHRYASREEGKELLLSNKNYYDDFTQNELDYKMQKKNAKMDEYLIFAGEQVLDFTDEEKTLIDNYLTEFETKLKENHYVLPELDEIVFIKTTMDEEPGAGGYTHGSQIYFSSFIMEMAISSDGETKEYYDESMRIMLWHEMFHCITRNNPEFRKKMYELIHFTVCEEDFLLPPTVLEYHISNPDVEHHDSFATFHIQGKDIPCFIDWVTTKHYEKEGETFFDYATTALIPIDGTDIYYTPEEADNFDEVFGKNTDYVYDPEECMADNFSLAMEYGMDGPDGKGYPNPEIIEGILSSVKTE